MNIKIIIDDLIKSYLSSTEPKIKLEFANLILEYWKTTLENRIYFTNQEKEKENE